jgi:hypothetical protein
MGKLIVLHRVQEEAARETLVRGAEAEERARAAEREAEARRADAEEALSSASRVPVGEGSAQVLELRSRWRRQLEEHLVAVEVQVAALQGERISATEARRRLQAGWEAARERRRRMEERAEATRRDDRRRREGAAERERDDVPPRGSEG